MKTIKLLGWAFIALFMCANLIACSSSDDEAIITNQKKLVELESRGYVYNLNLKLSYNTKGLLESVIEEEEDYLNASYTWFSDNIESIHQDYYKTKDKYYLTNGLITKQISTSTEGRKTSIYKYNDSKQFIEMECTNANRNQFLTYENNKLVEYNDRFDSLDSLKFTYGQQTCKGYFPWEIVIKVFCYNDIEIINVAHPELFNMRTNQLPTAIETKYGKKYELDYDFDEDGYISQIFCEAGNFFIRLKWE